MAPRAKPRRLVLALAASLTLHALLIALEPRPAERHDTRAAQALRVTLRAIAPPMRPADAPAPSVSDRGTGSPRTRAAGRQAPAAAPARPEPARAPANAPAPSAEAAPAGPAPNAATLLESARGIAREIGRERATPEIGTAPRGSPVERAFARHLARSDGSAEKVLADGSRWVRFRNGTCMHIPLVPHAGQVNGLGERITTTTNCPESLQF